MAKWCVILLGDLGALAPVNISREIHTCPNKLSAKEFVQRAVKENKFVEAYPADEPKRKVTRANVADWLAAD
jgi:hypothetical protein